MRTRLFLFLATSLFAVTGMIILSETAYTQAPQAGAGGQGGRGGGQGGRGGQGARGAGNGQQGGGGQGGGFGRANTPTFPGPPAGMQALPIDMFTSKNFYKDKDLWSDKRYFRCNTPRQITDIWTSRRIGDNPPASASWGDCSIDYPREKIVSPYPYKTAKEHYDALMAAAKAKGGPTVYTKATMPDWDGWYTRDNSYSDSQWIWGTINQVSTILSVLTPEYQKRMVQMNYHEGVDNSPQWNASFCYPEGFMRWWSQASQGGNFQLTMNVNQGSVSVRNRRQLPASGSDRQRACAEGPAMVRRDGRLLGWNDAGDLDRECPGLDAVALDVRIQRQARNRRNVRPGVQQRRLRRTQARSRLLRSRCVCRAAARHDAFQPASRPGQSDAAIYLYRMLEQSPQHQRQTAASSPRAIRGSSTTTAGPGRRTGKSISRSGWDKPQDDLPADVLDILDRLDGKKK